VAKTKADTRDPLESQLDGNLRTLHGRGLSDPQLHDLQALLLVARALSQTGTDLGKIEAALRLAISDYGEETVKIEVAELWFGLKPETRGLPSSRRHVIAWEYAKDRIAGDKGFQNFRTHRASKRYKSLASKLFVRYREKTSRPPTPTPAPNPIPSQEALLADPQDARTEPAGSDGDLPPAFGSGGAGRERRLAGRRWLQVSLALVAVATTALTLANVWTGGRAQAPTLLPSLSRLYTESKRHLTGDHAPSPGSVATSELGFGDPTPQGRITYHEVNKSYFPPLTPTFDSIVNGPYGGGNELEFLGVTATRVTDGRELGKPYRGRAVLARPGDTVWIEVFLDNNAEVTPHCGLSGPSVAIGTRLELGVWNSPDNHLHVIRGWLSAANTTPRWITDAVAVVTSNPTTLEPDSSISREFSWLNPHYSGDPVTNVESVLIYPGLSLNGNGVIGSCYDNTVYLTIAFRQS
jgi:hypothetical protein